MDDEALTGDLDLTAPATHTATPTSHNYMVSDELPSTSPNDINLLYHPYSQSSHCLATRCFHPTDESPPLQLPSSRPVCSAFGALSHQLQGVALFGGESRTNGWFIFFFSFLCFSSRNYIHKNILYALHYFLIIKKKKKKKPCPTSHADIISSYSNLFNLSSTSKTVISEYI